MTQRPVRPLTSTDARRAIYVDFECLTGKPPHPALLGVLIGADGPDGPDGKDLEQIIITDPRLAPARVAKKERLRVVAAADAGAELVAMALADGRKIVGWSYFDRDRLIEACPGLEGEIRTTYVNALELARPWRSTIHPEVRIERADPHSPKHTLDKYRPAGRLPRRPPSARRDTGEMDPPHARTARGKGGQLPPDDITDQA